MHSTDSDYDRYELYEEQFNPAQSDRQARRKRKPKAHHVPKKRPDDLIDDVTEFAEGLEAGFNTTYTPSKFEHGWLLSSLRDFFNRALITDVLAQVKGGKEASVYRCAAHPSTGQTYLAAKVYRPRMFRQLRNDKAYREGRAMLNADGREVKEQDKRLMRAVDQKSSLGALVQHTSWLMYEYTTLQKLYAAGAPVPRPVGSAENALLMSYHGDGDMPAPALNSVRLEEDEAEALFQETMRTIEMLLDFGLVHGDLSAYNILYWEGQITIIDFPQVVKIDGNPNARAILQRDLIRVCEYFMRQGLACRASAILEKLWPHQAVINYFEE